MSVPVPSARVVTAIVLVACASIAGGYCFLQMPDGVAPWPEPHAEPQPLSPSLQNEAVRRDAEPVTAGPIQAPLVSPGSKPNKGEDPFPEDYTGVRDENMVQLYSVFKKTLESEAKRLSDSTLTGSDLIVCKELFVRHSAYVSLIQQQRFFYYGYDRLQVKHPANSADAVYHTTGMGDMHVVFELTRADFPEVFEQMRALREVNHLPR